MTEPLPHEWAILPPEALRRFARLELASPLYGRLLRQTPAWFLWLEEKKNLRSDFRYQALFDEWAAFSQSAGVTPADEDAYLDALRRWRRMMSLRISYRSVNELASEKTSVEELTRLAEFCIRACCFLALHRTTTRFGAPWDDDLDRPARFTILALGKLGGEELNFSSDVDLIYAYEGDGYCRRDGQPSALSTAEYYTKVAELLTNFLSASTSAGFLFRVDARLRPEGAVGPLVRSVSSLENYYTLAGQTWERLAWIKARPVAGDLSLGGELLESLQSFRYPRHPPLSLLTEVSQMKARTEKEIVGNDRLHRDVKSGPGGIRDIEFIVQAFQLLHAGRYPFLQTHRTEPALEQLARYELLSDEQAEFLRDAYWFLRQVEHRIQMREEQQTHTLPTSPDELNTIAQSLGFDSAAAMQTRLSETQSRVRKLYDSLFEAPTEANEEFETWWEFLTSNKVPAPVQSKLQHWFGNATESAQDFRIFACGDASRMVTREQVTRFQHLAQSFDALMPELADPLGTLKRLARFAERYGSRAQFFSTCASNPDFLRVLALLFDRSRFVHELLVEHPEVFEEVLRPEILRQRKHAATLRSELAAGPSDAAEFAAWLALYVRAEQVRYAIGELVGSYTAEEVEEALTLLADAVIDDGCRRDARLKGVLVVALGKYGGSELTYGSDLDLLFVADEAEIVAAEAGVRELLKILRGPNPARHILTVDTRLRPHGEAGPLVVSLSTFADYHRHSAQLWERQLLTRARVVCGPSALQSAFQATVQGLLYAAALSPSELQELWQMRLRIQNERDVVAPPERAFKVCAGGLVEIEFLVQWMQLLHGPQHPRLRTPSTREGPRRLVEDGVMTEADGRILSENYVFLKRLELAVRRDDFRPISILPQDLRILARWLGVSSPEQLMADHRARLCATRKLVLKLLFPNGAAHPTMV